METKKPNVCDGCGKVITPRMRYAVVTTSDRISQKFCKSCAERILSTLNKFSVTADAPAGVKDDRA